MNTDAHLDAASANECAECGQPIAWGIEDEDANEMGVCCNRDCHNQAVYIRHRLTGLITIEPPTEPTRATLYVDDCPFCERMRERGETFFPRHVASDRCESGKHAHCSCDTCF